MVYEMSLIRVVCDVDTPIPRGWGTREFFTSIEIYPQADSTSAWRENSPGSVVTLFDNNEWHRMVLYRCGPESCIVGERRQM